MIEAGLAAAAIFLTIAVCLCLRERRRKARRALARELNDRYHRYSACLREDRDTYPYRTPGTDLGLTYTDD